MAFFNLTKLGVADPIKAAVQKPNHHAMASTTTTTEEDGTVQPKQTSSSPSFSEVEGSHVKYTERLTKHQRNEKNPNEIYSTPITSSQDYGWWREGEAPKPLT